MAFIATGNSSQYLFTDSFPFRAHSIVEAIVTFPFSKKKKSKDNQANKSDNSPLTHFSPFNYCHKYIIILRIHLPLKEKEKNKYIQLNQKKVEVGLRTNAFSESI